MATPHGLDFAHAAALYGCGFERAEDLEGFRAALGRALAADRTTIVSVRTDREANVALHRRRSGSPSGPPPSVRRRDARAPGHPDRRRPTTGTAERPERTTSKGIGAGDIVLVDKKGRRFHALVTELEQLETGRFELVVRPLDSRISWRTASVREVVEVWRRAGRPRA